MVHHVLRSPGQPLAAGVRAFMEPRFARDFSHVRLHTGVQAAESAHRLSALAYTVGRDVVFARGQYAPQTTAGLRLLAHELTHVVQQGGSPRLQRQVDEVPAPPAEVDAVPEEETASEEEAAGDVVPEERTEPLEAGYLSEGSPTIRAIVPAHHASEREADAIGDAIVSRSPDEMSEAVGKIAPLAAGSVHRKLLWDDRSRLTWADFQGAPNMKSQYDAATFSGFSEKWTPVTDVRPDNPVSPTPCTARGRKTTQVFAMVSLDISPASLHAQASMEEKKSWVKPGTQTAALLEHEQGHFDISHVMARKTDDALTWWGIGKGNNGTATACGERAAVNEATRKWNALNPKATLDGIIKSGLAKLRQAQDDYDDATVHGANAAQQKAWLGKIVADLPGYDV